MNYQWARRKYLIQEIERKGYFLDKFKFLNAVERSIVPELDIPFKRIDLYRRARSKGHSAVVSFYQSIVDYNLLRKGAVNNILASVLSDIVGFDLAYGVQLCAEETNIGSRLMNRKVSLKEMVEGARTNFDLAVVFTGNAIGALEPRRLG